MAITYFGAASNPADNSTTTSPNGIFSITPPASMQAGDLCVLTLISRATASPYQTLVQTMQPAGTDGQAWTSLNLSPGNLQIYYATFNGTWTQDPAGILRPQSRNIMMGAGFAMSTTSVTSGIFGCVLLVFRPTSTSNTWDVDVAATSSTYTAPANPYTVTRTGLTTVANNAVAIATFYSGDDNIWGTLSGANWVQVGSQYRVGSNMSTAYAYQIVATGGTATGNVSLNQTALGGDAGTTVIVAFKEV
jgi:hypothetical protein